MRFKHIIFILILSPCFIRGQSAFINKGIDVYIQQQALVEVQGDFINDTTIGSINNDGTIEITGNFNNVNGAKFGVYNNASSTERVVKFTGSGKQLIQGAISAANQASFYNLVVDQSSSSDTVEMQAGVVIQGSLVFGSANLTATYNPYSLYTNHNQKGIFKTYSDSLGEFLLDIQNGNVDAVAGYPVLETGGTPSTGFVFTSGLRGSSNGGLQRAISSATSYVFPVGTVAKGFNGVQLNFSKVPGGGSVKTKFCDGSSNPNGYVGQISNYCSGCNDNAPTIDSGYNRFFANNPCNNGNPQWLIFEHTAQNHGYWSFSSSNTGYQDHMEVFPNSFGSTPNGSWRVLKHEASYGTDPSLSTTDWRPEIESLVSGANDLVTYTKNAGCYTGNGVPGGLYTDFSQFTLGMSNENNALPVKLLYIQATATGKHHISVGWATALEINNAGFYVLRSTDGINFSNVGWVVGHDNSTVNQTYTFDDKVPQENIPYYYQLKQVDNNGNFQYSNIAEATIVDNGPVQSDFALFPNPTANDFFLTVDNPADEIKVRLYDIQGRLVYDNIFTVQQNGISQTVTVNASSVLPPGTYVVNASTNGEVYKKIRLYCSSTCGNPFLTLELFFPSLQTCLLLHVNA